ncbi:class I SAM-dependent methyltransferase [Oceanotoga sp. DSM 15011]|uniref:class I SAM-dependent methyltransferase n=1 Tax=Oceanotoga sp. DSM 15011 TaxID=2984951 RepID=UPI0021F4AEC0|nr:class I SAM-dependent methyltransferase [Oceanotoga sp. DSM 15011]UYP01332.1 class I SAM-dependent methyltransferase [Oceanotoga sp. DSM 15011]
MSFDSKADKWDTEYNIERAKIISDELINSIETNKDFEVLDFGCGTGLISFNLKDYFKSITLVDLSQGMIDKVNEKISVYNTNNMKAFKTDINAEGLKNMNFDLIYTSMALHHIIDVKKTLKELHKVLKDNGKLCIIELCEENGDFHKSFPNFKGHNGFDPEVMKEWVKKSGFKNIDYKIIFESYKNPETKEVPYKLFMLIAKK